MGLFLQKTHGRVKDGLEEWNANLQAGSPSRSRCNRMRRRALTGVGGLIHSARSSGRMANAILFFLLHGIGVLLAETVWLKTQFVLFGATPASYGTILFVYFIGNAMGAACYR